jgi:hypothetical protein
MFSGWRPELTVEEEEMMVERAKLLGIWEFPFTSMVLYSGSVQKYSVQYKGYNLIGVTTVEGGTTRGTTALVYY